MLIIALILFFICLVPAILIRLFVDLLGVWFLIVTFLFSLFIWAIIIALIVLLV